MIRKQMVSALLAACLILPVAAFAQNNDALSGFDALSRGQPVPEVQIGQPYVAESHGDWEIRCVRVPEGEPEPCQMYQLLRDAQNSPIAEFNVFEFPDQDGVVASATVVTPLETLLTAQLLLRVDDGQATAYPFSFCQQIGCFVRIALTQENLDAMQAGDRTFVSLVPMQSPETRFEISASLVGFTAAFEALSLRSAQALQLLQAQQENAEQ